MPTREQYEAAFEKERQNEYPVIDEFERRMGFAVDRERLEAAARVLACPVKKNPPNWQHGRVVYALGRKYLTHDGSCKIWLDIGTAKGFSAMAMMMAAHDAHIVVDIQSFDIIDPLSDEPRNSIADGQDVYSFTKPFIPKDFQGWIEFRKAPVPAYIANDQIGFAFIDGSHTYEGVKADIATVVPHQRAGDIILFDDVNKDQVNRAVREMTGYELEYIKLLPNRAYAIAVKK